MGITGGTWNFSAGGGGKSCALESGGTTTWNTIFDPHMPTEPNTVKEVVIPFTGDRPMLPVHGFPLPAIPCKCITAKISYGIHEVPIVVNFDHMVAYCFRDVLKDESRFLGADGGPPGIEGTESGRTEIE